jgi:hypothetical protein
MLEGHHTKTPALQLLQQLSQLLCCYVVAACQLRFNKNSSETYKAQLACLDTSMVDTSWQLGPEGIKATITIGAQHVSSLC